MKTNQMGVLYFTDNVPLGAMLEEGGIIEGQVRHWRRERVPLAFAYCCRV